MRFPDLPILAGVCFAWVLAALLFIRNESTMFWEGMRYETARSPRSVAVGIAVIATAILLIDSTS